MKNQYDNLIEKYGITDPKPVIEKIKKSENRFQNTADKQIKELTEKIEAKKRLELSEKILNKNK